MSTRPSIARRFLRHRRTIALIVLLLLLNALFTPRFTRLSYAVTILDEWRFDFLFSHRSVARRIPVQIGGAWVVHKTDQGKWTVLDWTAPRASGSSRTLVTWDHRVKQTGLWSPIVETTIDDITMREPGGTHPFPTNREDRESILKAIQVVEPSLLNGRDPSRYPYGRLQKHILWFGVLNDLFVVFLFGMLALSVRWTILYRREVRALRKGSCPKCRYPTTGLVTPTCPECSAALTPSEVPLHPNPNEVGETLGDRAPKSHTTILLNALHRTKCFLGKFLRSRWAVPSLLLLVLINAYFTRPINNASMTVLNEVRTEIASRFFRFAPAASFPTGGTWLLEQLPKARVWNHYDWAFEPNPKSQHAILNWNRDVTQTGIWSPIVETIEDDVIVRPPNSIDNTMLDHHARTGMLWFLQEQFPKDRSLMNYAYSSRAPRILWLGVLNDLFVLSLFIAIVFSIRLNLERIRQQRANSHVHD